jgi:preprotein translocase subunit YajC
MNRKGYAELYVMLAAVVGLFLFSLAMAAREQQQEHIERMEQLKHAPTTQAVER